MVRKLTQNDSIEAIDQIELSPGRYKINGEHTEVTHNFIITTNCTALEQNKKMREALEEILDEKFDPSNEVVGRMMLMSNPPKHAAVYKIRDIARETLKEIGE